MAKTERLFALLDALRRRRRPVTAETLATEMGVSTRTIYRDVQALSTLGVSVEGEGGVGYVLGPGFFLPPLMFDESELEALVAGARWVQQLPDAQLSQAAANALAKIESSNPLGRIGIPRPWPCSSIPTCLGPPNWRVWDLSDERSARNANWR